MKKIRNMIKEITLMICCSYSVVVAINVFLSSDANMMNINAVELQKAFWLCVSTGIIMEVLISLPYPKEWMNTVCSIVGMFIAVFGVGTFVLDLIPLQWSTYISVSVMIMIVYFVTATMVYAIQKNDADVINEKLSQKIKYRKGQKHG